MNFDINVVWLMGTRVLARVRVFRTHACTHTLATEREYLFRNKYLGTKRVRAVRN